MSFAVRCPVCNTLLGSSSSSVNAEPADLPVCQECQTAFDNDHDDVIDEELGTSIAHTRFNSFSRTHLAALVLGTAIFLITLGAKAADVFILILLAGMLLAAVAGFWCIRFVVERLRRKVYGEEADRSSERHARPSPELSTASPRIRKPNAPQRNGCGTLGQTGVSQTHVRLAESTETDSA